MEAWLRPNLWHETKGGTWKRTQVELLFSPPNEIHHVICPACFRGDALIMFFYWFIPYVTLSWFEREKAPGTALMAPGAFFCSFGGNNGNEVVCRQSLI